VPLILRLDLSLRMLWIQRFVDFCVLTICLLDFSLLVNKGLREFLWVELLLVVDRCGALAFELLVAQILLIDIDHL